MLLKMNPVQMRHLFRSVDHRLNEISSWSNDSLWMDILHSGDERFITAVTLNSKITLPEFVQDQITKHLMNDHGKENEMDYRTLSMCMFGPKVPPTYFGLEMLREESLDGMDKWLMTKMNSQFKYPDRVTFATGKQELSMPTELAFKFSRFRSLLNE